jgi:radical SAM protein (TIGR01212 family)
VWSQRFLVRWQAPTRPRTIAARPFLPSEPLGRCSKPSPIKRQTPQRRTPPIYRRLAQAPRDSFLSNNYEWCDTWQSACPSLVPHRRANRRELPEWRKAGLRYHAFYFHLRRKFGFRVQKVSVDAGFTCPNVDGSVAVGGCTFCDNRSFSPSRRLPRQDLLSQIEEGIKRLKRRYDCDHFQAYFQPATNTYAPVPRLRAAYERVLQDSRIVGLAIGTRPDCVPDPVLDLLEELARRTYVSVEYGVQTIHNRSLDWMNRGHHYEVFPDAVARSRGRGFELCAHIILGLPGETREDMLATAREMARQRVDSIKLHNLYAVQDTPLADQVARGEVRLMERDEYVETLVDFLELLPPEMIVERISGDAPPDYFVGPSWCLDKPSVKAAVQAELERRDTWQGKRFVE